MAAVFKFFGASGAASALLLAAALLAAGARADDVTTERCSERGARGRVRLYQEDSHATWLDMYSCGLTNMTDSDFKGLPHLYGIHLANNELGDINQAALCLVPTVQELYLHRNKLRELPVFDGCSCSNLTTLHVSNNLLTAIASARTFSSCQKLHVLFLDSNRIEYLHPETFSRLSELLSLSLDNNKIRYIPDKMFANNRKLEYLSIHNNRITHLAPDFASRFKRAGAGGGLKTFYFFNNPWHCACLLELLADVKRADADHYNDYYNHYYNSHYKHDGTRPACVYAGAEPCCRRPPAGLLRPAPRAAPPPAR